MTVAGYEIISVGTLATLRALNVANLPSACTILAAVHTDGPGGVDSVVWAPDAAFDDPTPCRLSVVPGSAMETTTADQLRAGARWIVVFAAGLVIPTTARLVVTVADPDGAIISRDLDVVGIDVPKSYSMLTKVRCVSAASPTVLVTAGGSSDDAFDPGFSSGFGHG